jgi:hypothetical protein
MRSYTIYPGEQRLLSLSVVDPSIEHFHYELSTQESIGDPVQHSASLFAYLIPVGHGNLWQKPKKGGNANPSDNDAFLLADGDTVYTMRKGIITCTPEINHSLDRIKSHGSLEVLHQDGTIMVYHHLDPSHLFYKAGDVVMPGSPLGLIYDREFLQVELYELGASEILRKIPIHYHTENGQILNYFQLVEKDRADYPDSLLTLEFTEKERRKIRSR